MDRFRCHVYLVSAAGIPNYGDELIARGWLRWLARRMPHASIILDSFDPARARSLHEGEHPHLGFADHLWNLARRSAHVEDAHTQVRRWVGGVEVPPVDLGPLLGAHRIHVLGGGYLSQEWPENFALLSAVSEARRLNRAARLHGTGLGLVPVADDQLGPVADALADFDAVWTRDPLSASALGIPIGPDDAFLARAAGAVPVLPDAPEAMVLLQGDVHDSLRLAGLVPWVIECLRAAGVPPEAAVGLVEAIPDADSWFWPDFQTRWTGAVRRYSFGQVMQDGLPVRPGQKWFTTRFHPHLVASSLGASGVAINTGSDYYDVKHRSLLDAGSGWAYASDFTNSRPMAPASGAGFPETAEKLSEEAVRRAKRLYPRGLGGFRVPGAWRVGMAIRRLRQLLRGAA